ncbi:MAG: lysophospholipase [Solirubrobacteraceae bacterium]
MTHRTASLRGAGGRSIFWQSWTPQGPPRAVVVLVHGAGEHSGRYEHVVARLVTDGVAVYAADHRGHGRSEGPRALVERLDLAVADLDAFVVLASAAHPGVPVIMLGHSMGGLIALRYAAAHQQRLTGLILSAPLAAVEAVPAALQVVARVLSRVAPRLPLIAIDPGLVSRDPGVVAAYESDPLVHHGKLPARTATEFADAVARLPADVATITVPTLLLYGTADRLCAPAGSEMIARGIGAGDLTVKAYDGLYHEIFNEPERDVVLDDVCAWLADRVGTGRDPAGASSS